MKRSDLNSLRSFEITKHHFLTPIALTYMKTNNFFPRPACTLKWIQPPVPLNGWKWLNQTNNWFQVLSSRLSKTFFWISSNLVKKCKALGFSRSFSSKLGSKPCIFVHFYLNFCSDGAIKSEPTICYETNEYILKPRKIVL